MKIGRIVIDLHGDPAVRRFFVRDPNGKVINVMTPQPRLRRPCR
jgi:hypothetical protein